MKAVVTFATTPAKAVAAAEELRKLEEVGNDTVLTVRWKAVNPTRIDVGVEDSSREVMRDLLIALIEELAGDS